MSVYDGPMPGAGQYGLFAAQAQQAYQNALARINQQRGQFLQSAGFQGIYDASGKFTGTKVATGDGAQYGGYQQMLSGLGHAGDQVQADQAGRGFGGGLARQEETALGQQAGAATSQFGQQLLGGLGDLGNQQVQATQDYNNSLYEQMLQNIQGAISDQNFNPPDYSGVPPSQYGQPTKPPGFKPPGLPKKLIGRKFTGRGAYGYGRGRHGRGN